MSTEKLGQEPAFPKIEGYSSGEQIGISKRLYIATMAMQGLLASGGEYPFQKDITARRAFQYADEMLMIEQL